MFKALNSDQAHFIAILARAARAQRDALLGSIDESTLTEFKSARGEHNPIAFLGFEPLPPGDLQREALRKAVVGLPALARREVYVLMRIGEGRVAANEWRRGLAEAEALGDETVIAAILDDVDLHDHISKGLYDTNSPNELSWSGLRQGGGQRRDRRAGDALGKRLHCHVATA